METKLDLTYSDFLLGKKKRRISNPSEDLKAYQRSKLSKLEKIYFDLLQSDYKEIHSVPHGFVSGRNCVTAAECHIGYDMTIMLDISKFFDSVTNDMVAKVSFEASNDKYLFHDLGYTAQGFPTSPILCNIASLPFLLEIKKFLSSIYDQFAFTIYADDIQISIDRKYTLKSREENIIIKKVVQIAEKFNLTINKNKTRVRYNKYGFRRILGINVGSDNIRATRKTIRKIRAAKHQKRHHSFCGLTTWSKCYKPKKVRKL